MTSTVVMTRPLADRPVPSPPAPKRSPLPSHPLPPDLPVVARVSIEPLSTRNAPLGASAATGACPPPLQTHHRESHQLHHQRHLLETPAQEQKEADEVVAVEEEDEADEVEDEEVEDEDEEGEEEGEEEDRVEEGEDDGEGGEDDVSCRQAVDMVSVPPAGMPRPIAASSYLSVGQVFSGSQTVNVSNRKDAPGADEWRVNVTIQAVDLARGTIAGSMTALDVPKADSPVETFWLGDIIDNCNNFFQTRRWGAHMSNDIAHWAKFAAMTPAMREKIRRDGGEDIDLSSNRFIFMRWKEQFFVNVSTQCGLTIAGFYYVCIDRATGVIAGLYYDANSVPFQALSLTCSTPSPTGHASHSFDFN
jgi:glucose-induced degradation protein 4